MRSLLSLSERGAGCLFCPQDFLFFTKNFKQFVIAYTLPELSYCFAIYSSMMSFTAPTCNVTSNKVTDNITVLQINLFST